jgi:hydrogenase nickel incorporation protein HypB
VSDVKIIQVKENILGDNNKRAQALREELARKKVFLLNLMSSPGSGKTSLILQTIAKLRADWRFGVLEADIDSAVDAEKIAQAGIPAVQLHTGGMCHLDASMVAAGLQELDQENLDIVIIENVGNLVCPAEFDTGAVCNVMILSVPEGDDKPLKYPLMFSICDVLLINKTDYLPLSDFDMAAAQKRAWTLNPCMEIFPISAKTGKGVDAWSQWLEKKLIAALS